MLELKQSRSNSFTMPTALEQVIREVMNLPPRQRLALAEFLMESVDAAAGPEAEVAWDAEIRDRIRAIEEGRTTGVAYEDAMRAAEIVLQDTLTSVTDETRAELRRRRKRYLQHPASGRTWEQVKQQARQEQRIY